MRFQFKYILLLLLAAFIFAQAAAKISPKRSIIKIGSTATLTGLVGPFGKDVVLGTKIYFDRVNASGGIGGYPLQLIVMDNKYDPVIAAHDVEQLIDQDKVLALTAVHGSAVMHAVVPIVNEKKTLLYGAFTGTDILYKNPPDRYVINFRPSYAEEIRTIVKHFLAAGIQPDDFAFFIQDDAYGFSIYQSALKVLKVAGYDKGELLPVGRYVLRNLQEVADVQGALNQIKKQATKPPKIFIVAGSAELNTDFINLASQQYPHAFFVTLSGILNTGHLDKKTEGKVFSSQVVPALNAHLPAIREYQEDLLKYAKGEKPDYVSLNSYLAARLLVVGLKKAVAENKLTREGVIDVMETLNDVDMGMGVKIHLSQHDHTAQNNIWLTVFKDQKLVAIEWSKIPRFKMQSENTQKASNCRVLVEESRNNTHCIMLN